MSLKTLLDELNNGKAITYLDQERMLPLCELHTFRRYFIRLEVVEGIPIDVEQIRKGRTTTNVYRLGLEVDA